MLNLSTLLLTSLLTLSTLNPVYNNQELEPSIPDSYENNIDENLFSNGISNTNVENTTEVTNQESEVDDELSNLVNYKLNSSDFNAYIYYTNYPELQDEVGLDGDKLLIHYLLYGKSSGKVANRVISNTSTEDVNSTKTKETTVVETNQAQTCENAKYVLNTKTGKFHTPDCSWVNQINPANYMEVDYTYEVVTEELGYEPCKHCHPY